MPAVVLDIDSYSIINGFVDLKFTPVIIALYQSLPNISVIKFSVLCVVVYKFCIKSILKF